MFKTRIKMVLLFTMLFTTVTYANTGRTTIDTSKTNQGIISASYNTSSNKNTKVMISKGSEKYTYDLKSKGQFALQMGNGEYTIHILENVSGKQYKVIKTEKVNVKTADKNQVFLQSTEMINWNNNMDAIKKAKELTKNAKTDQEKATLIYNFVTSNMKYDFKLANSVKTGYVPAINNVYNTFTGICFDYSVLYAAMLRSVGVPTKVIMGYRNDMQEYHAWNEVYLSETDQWITIDTTYDAPSVQTNIATAMIKANKQYKTEKIY